MTAVTVTTKNAGDLITESDYNAILNKIQNATDGIATTTIAATSITSTVSSGSNIALVNSGSGISLTITNSSTGVCMALLPSNTGVNTFYGTRDSDKELFTFLQARSDTSGSNKFYRNLGGGADTSGPVLHVHQVHASDDQDCLRITQSATAATALAIITSTSASAIVVNNGADKFRVTSGGEIRTCGDAGGEASFVSFTGTTSAATAVTTSAKLKIYIGTTAYYVPCGTVFA